MLAELGASSALGELLRSSDHGRQVLAEMEAAAEVKAAMARVEEARTAARAEEAVAAARAAHMAKLAASNANAKAVAAAEAWTALGTAAGRWAFAAETSTGAGDSRATTRGVTAVTAAAKRVAEEWSVAAESASVGAPRGAGWPARLGDAHEVSKRDAFAAQLADLESLDRLSHSSGDYDGHPDDESTIRRFVDSLS